MGKTFIDRTNQRYGRLVATHYLGKPEGKSKPAWQCQCDCGAITVVPSSNLATGHTTSCGCFRTEALSNRRQYPEEFSEEYKIWRSIKQRTGNHAGKNHKWYAGVSMSKEWAESFFAFLKDMGKRPSNHHSVERLDGSLGYLVGNCIWATPKEQANNRCTNVRLQHDQQDLTVAQWAEKTHMKQATIAARVRRGWDVETSLTAPLNTRISNGTK